MRVIFMGTPEFSVPCLEHLSEAHNVVAVFTQPDRPKGRGKQMAMPPVKKFALQKGIKVYQPLKIKTGEMTELIASLSPDVIIVIAYGQIISQEILDIPEYGCINVHASLLPVLRGASPINMAIVRGLNETGVTTMQMDKGLDTGDMLLKQVVEIDHEMTAGELHDRLMHLSADLLKNTLEQIDSIIPQKQDDSQASYAPILNKEMAQIDWTQSAQDIHNLIRGFNPWPVAFSSLGDKRLKIYRSSIENKESKEFKPGEILSLSSDGMIVQTGRGLLNLMEIQLPGKKRITSAAFAAGHKLPEGAFLE